MNLAALLVPSYDVDRDQGMKLASSLTIVQFMRAFGRFKRVICQAYPSRRDELDGYEALIHDIHHLHGEKFYEYHKIFSMRSAMALQVHKMKLDWSQRDSEIYTMISAHLSASCSKCGEFSHQPQFCPSLPQSRASNSPNRHSAPRSQGYDNVDVYGRQRVYKGGAEICNNFNGERGCKTPRCSRQHRCFTCNRENHGASSCRASMNTSGRPTSTPGPKKAN